MSVINNQPTLRNIPKDRTPQRHCGGP